LTHINWNVGKERSTEIPLPGVGQHAENSRSLGSICRYTQGRRERRARGDSHEDALFAGEFPAPTLRFCVWNAEDFVDPIRRHRVRCELRDEVRTPTLQRVRFPYRMTRRCG